MRSDSFSDSRISANWSPDSRASVSCGFSSRPSRRASVSRIESPTAMPTESLTCLKRSRSITITVGLIAGSTLAKRQHRLEPVDEQLAVGQAGEVVVHGVVQQPLLGVLEFGDVGERADQPHHLAVGADHRPRLEREPQVVAVGRAQAEVLHQPAAALLQHAVERGAEAVAVERMQHVEPARRRAFERAALEPEQRLGLRAGEHLVGGDVPVPDHVAGAGQRQRAALDVGDDAVGDAAGEGVLHHREADQHHDQHQAAEQRRADDVVGDDAGHGERRPRSPRPPAGARSGSAAPRGRSRGCER